MISLETIEREINEIVATCDTTYYTCQRLSWLYIVRDHLRPSTRTPTDGEQGLKTPLSGSEFLELASEVDTKELLLVIDEHLETIRTLFPKSYESLMAKIRELT